VIRDGTLLTIRVADANGKITMPDAKGNPGVRDRRFFLGVASDSGMYRSARLVGSSPGQYVFLITVPRRRQVRLFVDSDLDLSDPQGRPVELKRQSSYAITPDGAEQLTLDLRVN
jgi:hypothetical protein